MADQRSAFRFRLPWLPPQPPPPPRPSIAPRPVAPAAIPPPRQTPVPIPTNPSPPLETQIPMSAPPTQIAETNVPAQPPIAISTPVIPPQSLQTIQPPAISSANPSAETPVVPLQQAPPHSPLPPKLTTSESQPLSPSRATTQSQLPSQPSSPSRVTAPPGGVTSQPPSPSRAAAPTRVQSQPTSPSRPAAPPRVVTPQPSSPSRPVAPLGGVTSQPSSPSRPAAPPGGVTSQPSSPSRAITKSQTSPKSPTSTRPVSSPSRAVPPSRTITPPSTPYRTASQPPSTPQTTSQPQPVSLFTSGSVHVSSSSPPDQHKPLSETITESTSPNQPKLSQERLQPSNTSQKYSPSPSDKEQRQKYKKLELKAQDGLNDSMNQTSRQPPDESNPPKGSDTLDQTDKKGTSNVERQSKHFPEDLKPEVTKEVKEVLKETYEKAGHEDDTVAVSDIQAKEQTHESVGGKKVIPRHKEIRDDISKLVHKMATEDPKNSTTNKPVSVITLAGENRGASMQLGFDSSNQRGAIHIRRGYKIKPDENDGTTTNEEGSIKDKLKDTKGIEDQAREAYVNSNIQGINNSIMFESNISERNPGVHITHSQFPKEGNQATRRHEKQHGKSHMVHAQKLTHHPTVKRRCLRGLFLESSDSDSDDSSKARRHGCRVGCSKKSEDNKNNLL